jgi:N6-L-threonylcarbamoyladenine synthase
MAAGSLDYSFSGIKTGALHYLRTNGLEPVRGGDPGALPQWEYDLIASYQKRVVDHLLQRARKAALALRPRSMVMTGGVACNSLLRERFSELGADLGIETAFPSPGYCTDNAAMVAFHGLTLRRAGKAAGSDADAFATAAWERIPEPFERSA